MFKGGDAVIDRRFLVLVVAASLTGCAPVWEARLYPVNDATQGGVVSLYLHHQSGLSMGSNGEATATMPDGERLIGDYTALSNMSTSVGSGFATVQSGASQATASAVGTAMSTSGMYPATATLLGDRGTRMNCESLFSAGWQQGQGACMTNSGAQYRAHIRSSNENR